MVRVRIAAAALGIMFSAACSTSDGGSSGSTAGTAAPAADAAADETAIRAANAAWFKEHQAGNVEGVVSHYAADAVVSPAGAPSVRGTAAIRDLFAKEIQAMAAAGLTQAAGTNSEIEVSGDLAYEWNTYMVTDQSGKTVDTGKYVSVFARRDGKWVIVRDIWNSDVAPPGGS